MTLNPNNLKYAPTHEWVHIAGDTATVGVTDFAVNLLSDLVFVDLPALGRVATSEQTIAEVESVKAVSDIYAPVSGAVAEVNTALKTDIAPISTDPFGAGWLVKLTSPTGFDTSRLMDRTAYEAHCKGAD